jgi:hypothetical protein
MLLRSTLRDPAQGQFAPSSTSVTHLRGSISDLAHYNAIQVIAVHLCPANGSAPLPGKAILSARATLQLVLETRTKGTTMCLWMWLYYAFTAAVVLFLNCISDPLDADAVLDLALLDELKGLCDGLAAGSDGARRVREIVDGMGRVAWEVVKRGGEEEEEGSWKARERRRRRVGGQRG